MKASHSKWSAAAFALVLLATMAYSQALKPVQMHGDGMFSGHMLEHMTKDLDLTDAQQSQIKELTSKQEATLKPLFVQMGQEHQQMMQLIQSGTFDENKARQIATQQAQLRIEMDVQMARTGAQIYQLLTPEQKTKAADLMKQHEQHMMRHSQEPPPPPPDTEND